MNLRHPRHLRLKNHTDKLSFNSCNLLKLIFNIYLVVLIATLKRVTLIRHKDSDIL